MVRTYLISLSMALFFSTVVEASSCCGQSGGSFPVAYLKQRLSLNLGLSKSQAQGRVQGGSGKFVTFASGKDLIKDSANFEVVHSLLDRHQFFAKTSFFKNSFESVNLNQQKSDFSDLVLGYTFEVVPEYVYSKWKPVVYLSALANLPTGRSVHDPSGLAEGADVTGYDQWGVGAGLTLRKIWFPVRLIVQFKSLALFADDLSGVYVSEFWEQSAGFTLAYSLIDFYDLSVSSGLTWQALQGREVDSIKTEDSDFVSFNFSMIKPISGALAVSFNYVDQTLIGTPENTLLNRAYSINLNYNFY